MNKYIKIIAFLLLLPPVLWAQDSIATPLPEIEYSATQGKVYEIAGIEITGAENYEDFVLIGFSGLAIGDKIEVPGPQITKALRRFWKQGLFSDVKIKATRIEGQKIWLEIALEQRPRISSINMEGLKKSEKEDLEVKIGLQKGGQYTPNLVDRTKTAITKYYGEKGFHNVQVFVSQQPDPDHPGYVRVRIGVDKKQKTKVGKIYITGNEALTDVDINKAMKKTNDDNIVNLFRTKKFVVEEYEKDKKAVIEKYNEVGYRDAYIVSDSVVPNPDDPTRVDVYMHIFEGKKYFIRNINWVGNTVYPYEVLNLSLGVKKGDIYNLKQLNKRLTEDDDAIAKLYTDQGYLFFNVDPVEVKVENDSIDFEMRMYEGKPATINQVNIV
ncbi:MAG: outer membrane protein assembly factor BamA, partial [Paludibacteraceae bacterium]|nr:outer membrane protein assembly factor BamA [Paludibacteraceae bacterium]